jgi:hypothetical protein
MEPFSCRCAAVRGSKHVRKSLDVSVPVAPCNVFAMLTRVIRYCGAVLEQRWDPAAVAT